MPYQSDEHFFPVWREPRSFWERTGLTERQERVLDLSLVALLVLFTAGWVYTAVEAVRRGDAPVVARQIGAAPTPLSRDAPPDVTFAMNALMERFIDWEEVRGASGEVRLAIQEVGDTLTLPEALPEEVAITYTPAGADSAPASGATERAPVGPGLWNLLIRMRNAVRPVPGVSVATLVPASAVRNDRIGGYLIGRWPSGEGAYAAPRGFVEVTPENMDTHVSTHFQLKDFLTKGQEGVWPKYVALSTRLLDKLELTLQELERQGHPVDDVFVISGFRTPLYNATGGNTQGRGALSRHMYGDAADIAIDNDGDACMDDLNGDGRADVQDARVVAAAAEAVERRYPHLVGGIGIYRPEPGAHCGMVHIDTRGHRARW
jgi:hypothetical protein